ncbi:hypothetical protein GE061_010493 [Apolygus lucorum]|uniref:Odorant receptor n=1 Tax=Apolygus lucorum TaxID=248454 RepID=A0A8S9XW20_APOLU|nr:hypothetical protein GE061_010493 [Apolygus lucorum]
MTSSVRLDKWQRIGYKLLLLGMKPEKFMNKFSLQKALVYLVFFVVHTMYSIQELVVALFFSTSLLERISHGYIFTYVVSFNLQWYYMLLNIENFHQNEVSLEQFRSTQAYFDFADRRLNRNINLFLKCLLTATAFWICNNTAHILGPLVETLLTFLRRGEFHLVALLPQAYSLPVWGQIIMYFHNALLTFLFLVYCLASYLVWGTRVLKVKTQCDILNEALRRDYGQGSNIKSYIKDHIKIIKTAKVLNSQMEVLNGIILSACYLEFATQMFSLSQFEPSGTYFFAVGFDLASIMLIMVIQCWFASIVTHALESIADAVYDSNWFRADKNNSLEVLIMLQMAQREYSQMIWFKSFKVERASTLNLVQSSYAVYAVLVILQEK